MDKKCCHHPLDEGSAKELLSHKGLNKTKVKIQILIKLSQSEKPLSVPEIHSLLKENCDVSTVFRSVTQFKEKHLIHEVNLEEGFSRYELAHDSEDNHHHHHHHVRCRKCGDIKNLEKCDLSAFEKAISKLGFKDMEHRLEFTGVCLRCSKKIS